MCETHREYYKEFFDSEGNRIEGYTLDRRYAKTTPDWLRKIDSMKFEEYISFMEKLDNHTEKCSCKTKTVTDIFHPYICIECWKIVDHITNREVNFDFIWRTPENLSNRWLLLDRKMYTSLFTPLSEVTKDNEIEKFEPGRIEVAFGYDDSWSYWNALKWYFYFAQDSICPGCGEVFEFNEMQLHHKLAVKEGGHEFYDNLVMLCLPCHTETENYKNKQFEL